MAQSSAPNVPRSDSPFVNPRAGTLTQEGLLMLEQLWRQVAAGFVTVPCEASGTNDITLTPTMHREGARTYADHMMFSAVPANTSTGDVSAKVADASGKSLANLKVYKDGGSTRASTGDVVADRLYLFCFVQSLDAGAGGFVLK